MLFRKMPMSEPSSRAIPSQWINGRDFLQTTEKCAITQLSTAMKNDLEIRDYDEKHSLRFSGLAKLQGTLFPILPVHTVEEQAFFKKMMSNAAGNPQSISVLISNASEMNESGWIILARFWNTGADGIKMFYKLPEHLQKHEKNWETARYEKNSLLIHAETHLPLAADLTTHNLHSNTPNWMDPSPLSIDPNLRIGHDLCGRSADCL